MFLFKEGTYTIEVCNMFLNILHVNTGFRTPFFNNVVESRYNEPRS